MNKIKGVKCKECEAGFHMVFSKECPKCKKPTEWLERWYDFTTTKLIDPRCQELLNDRGDDSGKYEQEEGN